MRKDISGTERREQDRIQSVYMIGAAVEHLADTLPCEQDGLSYILRLVGRDAKEQARALDDAENGQ